jgi:hypothetical protein
MVVDGAKMAVTGVTPVTPKAIFMQGRSTYSGISFSRLTRGQFHCESHLLKPSLRSLPIRAASMECCSR